jgi:hypothetical protein
VAPLPSRPWSEDWLAVRGALAALLLAAVVVGWNVDLFQHATPAAPLALDDLVALEPLP